MKPKLMNYVDLTKDRVFRRFFLTNKLVLFSLIKSFLLISDEALDWFTVNFSRLNTPAHTADRHHLFDELLYLQDRSMPPETSGGKQSEFDLRAKLPSGENIGIEMQNYAEKTFTTRMIMYLVRLHSQQPERGQEYAEVKPSYLLAFTLRDVLGEGNYINEIALALREPLGKEVGKDINMTIVELINFNKRLDELVDMRDRWCYIIKHSAQLTAEQVEYLSQDGETRMILEHLAEISRENREYWEAQSQFKREWEDQLRKEELEEKARAEGMQEGRTQGMQEGLVQGMQEGEVNKARGIALSMLQEDLEVSLISKVTGLTVAEIEQLNGRAAD